MRLYPKNLRLAVVITRNTPVTITQARKNILIELLPAPRNPLYSP